MKHHFLCPNGQGSDGAVYLLAHSAGCLPVATRAAVEEGFFAPWAGAAGDGWGQWLTEIDRFRAALAALLGGDAADWCPQPGVSAGIAKFLSGLDFADGRHVVLASAEAFPSVGFALEGLARLGLRLELVEGDPSMLANWQRIADPDVAAVVITHVHSNSGRVSPVAELGAEARAHGVISVVDVAQSAGILPIDIAQWPVDAVAGSALKWLCGGPGAGFLWVSPGLAGRVAPVDRGWFSHANPFEMDIRHFAFASDARAFWGGTPGILPYVTARTGIELITRIGVADILVHNRRLCARLAEQLPWISPPEQRGGTLCLPLDAGAEAALVAAGVRCDRRDEVLRLSFAIWNDDADVDRVALALRASHAGG